MTKAQIKKAYEAYGKDAAKMEEAGLTHDEINEVINYATELEPLTQKTAEPEKKSHYKVYERWRVHRDPATGKTNKINLLRDNVKISEAQAQTLNGRLHNEHYYEKTAE